MQARYRRHLRPVAKGSYHIKKLKDAGLVREERRGRWAFYSLDRESASALLGEAAVHLDGTSRDG